MNFGRLICLGWMVLLMAPMPGGAADQKEREEKLAAQVREVTAQFQKTDSNLAKFFETAHGYALFPRVGKGGAVLGGAHGRGQVFEKGKLVGGSKVTQFTIGLQLGGQTYSEVVFFETKEALDRFKGGKFALSAQASAVAAAEGASTNAKYEQGVAIFTLAQGGLMFEASVGGQKFSFQPAP
jgi:lipid-binding SYLF domain-containing protein